jgi:hypothetical protein
MSLFDLMTMPVEEMFQGFFLPFLVIFVITWGILSSLRVFSKRINMVLALALALLASATPQFTMFASYIAQMGANVSIIAFALVFGFGVLMWTFGSGRDIYYEFVAPSKKIEKLMKEERKLLKKAKEAKRAGNSRKAADLMKRAHKIRDDIELERKM